MMNRRSFLSQSLAAATIGTVAFAAERTAAPGTVPSPPKPAELKRPSPLAGEMVFEFVRAGHGDLAKVKQMLGDEPMLLNAMWDWGGGDWETALGGASHVGNRELALHLLEAGARIDAFCAAMLGETELLKSLLRFNPAAAMSRAPHGYTLLYHVGYPGNVELAAAIAAHIATDHRAGHFNQALQSSVARGHRELVRWLLANGVTDPNGKNFAGKTPLDVATSNGNEAIRRLLREAGGRPGNG